MIGLIKGFIKEEDGISTVEIVLIIAVLVGLAILFRNYIVDFVEYIISITFNKNEIKNPYDQTTPAPVAKPASTK